MFEFVVFLQVVPCLCLSFNMPRTAKGRFSKCETVQRAAKALKGRELKRRQLREAQSKMTEKDDSAKAVASKETPALQKPYQYRGRRLIHLGTFAEALAECKNPACGKPLVLKDCVEERRFGLGSVLRIPCRSCEYVNSVDTDSRVETKQQRGPRPFSSNNKAALGEFLLCGVNRINWSSDNLVSLMCSKQPRVS